MLGRYTGAGATILSAGNAGGSGGRSLPDTLTAMVASFKEINVQIEPVDQTIWCSLDASGVPCISRSILDELDLLRDHVRALVQSANGQNAAAPKFLVMESQAEGIFNLGGDLEFFVECIRRGNREALRQYAHDCVRLIYDLHTNLGSQIITVCLVQGDAFGGGLEAALSFHILIAEKGVRMGLPESLFSAFPGMGAYSFLARKIGPVEAERMITSGRIYSAEELFELGVVSILAEPGKGREAVRTFIRENNAKHGMLLALNKVRSRVMPVTYEELEEVSDIWVDSAMELSDRSLRLMEKLRQMQMSRINALRKGVKRV